MKKYNYFIKYIKGNLITEHSPSYVRMNYNFQIGHLRLQLRSIEKVFPNPEWHCKSHSHVYYEFHIIAEGSGTVIIENEKFKVKKGCFYLTGPNVKHEQISDPDDPMFEYGIKLNMQVVENYNLPDLSQKKEALSITQTLSNVYKYPFLDIYDTRAMVDDLYKVVENSNPGYTLSFQYKILEIINCLYQTVCDNNTHMDSYNTRNYKSHEEHIKKIVAFISKNYMNDINITDMEHHIILSSKHISRIMKREFNQTFYEYLYTLRLKKVRQLAEETTLTAEQIALQCGFSNVRNFYRVLEKYNCPTPSQIRAEIVR